MNDEFAKDSWSFATNGARHYQTTNHSTFEPDLNFSKNFITIIKKKLEKPSYLPFLEKYGPGYLVVSAQYPLFNQETFYYMRKAWERTKIHDQGYFRSIYLTPRMNHGYCVQL